MTTVTLLTRAECALCEHAKAVLARVGADHPLTVEEIGLDTRTGREMAVGHGVLLAPGILLDGRLHGYGRLSEKKLRRELSHASAARPAGGGR